LNEPTYEITVEAVFSASHQLESAEGGTETLHGHNFRVEATVGARELDRLGLVMDFQELEALLEEVLTPYDHRHLNDLPPFDRLSPSTENLAKLFFIKIQERLTSPRVELRSVRVWEAPTYRASYGHQGRV
jgi:6-pyruvoyltetrahydropterin/6-carboxytetrahydropterin synthase